jgi:hypothetical protein
MRKMSAIVAGMLLAAGGMALPAQGTAAAAPETTSAPAEKWEFTVTPYVLFSTMQGVSKLGNLPAINVDANPSDIFSHLQGGLMLYFEAKKGDWAFASDFIYMHLGQDVNPDTGWVSGSLSLKQYAWEGLVFYDFAPKLEVGLGFIGNKIDGRVSGTLTVGAGDSTTSRAMNQTWGMPVLGMRWSPVKGEHWSAVLFADYGGTSGSNWSWQVMPSVGYRFSTLFEASLQYRWIGIDYSTGSGSDLFTYEMNIFGPQLGLAFHF